jgi:hypothetical protein
VTARDWLRHLRVWARNDSIGGRFQCSVLPVWMIAFEAQTANDTKNFSR